MIYTTYETDGTNSKLRMTPKFRNVLGKTGIVFAHGAGYSADAQLSSYGNWNLRTDRLVSSGFPAIATNLGGEQTWGNSTSLNAMTDAYGDVLEIPGAATSKIAIVGDSMGGIVGLNWAARNASRVSCLVLTLPVIDLSDIYVNNRGGYQELIGAAYGGSYSDAATGGSYNPARIAENSDWLNDIPILLYYGTSDTICTPESAIAFGGHLGDNVTMRPLNGGHAEQTHRLVDYDEIIDFIGFNS